MIAMRSEKFWELQGDLSDAAFASSLGISRTQLWRARAGKASIGADFLEKFMVRYPELSVNDYFFVKTVATAPRKSTDETD